MTRMFAFPRFLVMGMIGVLAPFWGHAARESGLAEHSRPIASNTPVDLTFEVATVKPTQLGTSSGKYFRVVGRHLVAVNVNLFDLISLAYSLHPKQVVNGPKWMATSSFDIDGVPKLDGRPTMDQQRALYRSLLADRFHLVLHFEEREMPVYTLELDKGGPKLTATTRQPQDATNFSYTNQILLTVKNASMRTFCDGMQATFLDRPVVDKTGLTGRYDFTLNWTSNDLPAKETPDAPPDLYTAIKEQLGLKFVPEKAAAKALVVDNVDTPTAN